MSGRTAAFTLPELMIASTLFVMLTGAVIYTFLFGLQLRRTAEVKLTGNDYARKVLVRLTDEIHSATRVQIGAGGLTNFVEASTNTSQVGAAIQICLSSDTNNWIRYYCEADPSAAGYSRLCRATAGSPKTFEQVVPHALINTTNMFTSEDQYGNPVGNNQNNRVIGINLQLYQVENTTVQISSASQHDFFQLRTRITRRRLY